MLYAFIYDHIHVVIIIIMLLVTFPWVMRWCWIMDGMVRWMVVYDLKMKCIWIYFIIFTFRVVLQFLTFFPSLETENLPLFSGFAKNRG